LLAPPLRALDFRALDLRADDFFAPPLRVPPLVAADAPDARVLRRAAPLRRDPPFDVLPEDFERVAIGKLLLKAVCPAGTQELGTERHQRNGFVRISWPFDA
jgi:hypothetical protein